MNLVGVAFGTVMVGGLAGGAALGAKLQSDRLDQKIEERAVDDRTRDAVENGNLSDLEYAQLPRDTRKLVERPRPDMGDLSLDAALLPMGLGAGAILVGAPLAIAMIRGVGGGLAGLGVALAGVGMIAGSAVNSFVQPGLREE